MSKLVLTILNGICAMAMIVCAVINFTLGNIPLGVWDVAVATLNIFAVVINRHYLHLNRQLNKRTDKTTKSFKEGIEVE